MPVTLPEDDGAKRTCNVTLWPAATEYRGVPFVMENAAPEIFVCETVREAVPLFVRVTLCIAFPPTGTLPKLRFVGLAERVFDPEDWVFAVVYPVQPERPTLAKQSARDKTDKASQGECKQVWLNREFESPVSLVFIIFPMFVAALRAALGLLLWFPNFPHYCCPPTVVRKTCPNYCREVQFWVRYRYCPRCRYFAYSDLPNIWERNLREAESWAIRPSF